jgi:hypothetical protein
VTTDASDGHDDNGHGLPDLTDTAGAPQSAASKWRVIYPRPK